MRSTPSFKQHFFFGSLIITLFALASCMPPDPSVKMKPITDTYVAAWNGADLSTLDAIVDANFVRHSSTTPVVGLDSLKKIIAATRAAYPDFNVVIDDIFYTNDRSCARFTFTGTHSGLGGIVTAGQKLKSSGILTSRMVNGKIVEEWSVTESLSTMMQLGYTLTPPSMPKETMMKKK